MNSRKNVTDFSRSTYRNGSRPKLPFLANKILDNFDDGTPDIRRPFMAAEKINEEIPPRSGYYIGYKDVWKIFTLMFFELNPLRLLL